MPTAIRWTTEQKVSLLIELTEPVTWEEFHHGVQQSHALVREVIHPVDLLILVPANMPQGNPLMHFSSATQRQPDNLGSIIIVPPANQTNFAFAFAKRLSLIINKVYPKKSRVVFVGSLGEALAITGEEEAAVELEAVRVP